MGTGSSKPSMMENKGMWSYRDVNQNGVKSPPARIQLILLAGSARQKRPAAKKMAEGDPGGKETQREQALSE